MHARGSRQIEKLSSRRQPQWIEWLSSIYRANRRFLDGSRICREAIENTIKRRSKGLIDRLDIERYQEAVELEKNSFSKRGKTHRKECNQASYSTKDPNNLLSFQNHLSTRKNKAFRSKAHTHTHTH